jgi:Na+:H+ antiporter, NhaA family
MKAYFKGIESFVRWQASSGVALFACAVIALLWRNSPWGAHYVHLASMMQWTVNDVLMPFFFLLVGLEIKRESTRGELSGLRRSLLPVMAAVGGMVMPALIYRSITWQHPGLARGWGIPMATDIAFALGLLALLGSRIPRSLKIFLSAVAIVDDLGAVIVIAVFYTAQVHVLDLGIALILLLGVLGLNRAGVKHPWGYALLGLGLWWAILSSGVHPTIAGVLLAFCIPSSQLSRWEQALHLPVNYGVMPLFGLLNAGVGLLGEAWGWHPVMLGIMCGLVLGKVLGIWGASWVCVKCRWARLPDQLHFGWIWAVSWVAGIGFTMAFFISDLAFSGHSEWSEQAKLGILLASAIAGLMGTFWLLRQGRQGSLKRHR